MEVHVAYLIGKIIGIMTITAICSVWNYRKWRARHGFDREKHVLISTVLVMLFSFFGGLVLGLPATLISLWYSKKLPVLSGKPQITPEEKKVA